MSCDCGSCNEINEFQTNINKIEDEEVKEHFQKLYVSYLSLEMDRDRLKAIIVGTWPDADEQLREIRQKYQIEHAEDFI